MEDLKRIILEHPFFAGIDDEHMGLVAGCARNMRFRDGEFLFREGEEADTFYCLRTGEVALEIHSPHQGAIQIARRRAGDVVGWSWIVAPYRWYCDARAIGEVRALGFDAVCLRNKWETDKVFGFEMYRRFVPLMLASLQATRMQMLDVYGRR